MSGLSHLRAMRARALNEAAYHLAGGEFEAGAERLRMAFEFSDAVASMLVPSPVKPEPAERSEAAPVEGAAEPGEPRIQRYN